jgi:hypothetical protein
LIIDKLTIRDGMSTKTFVFSNGFNLITSNGANQVGKTTLIRALLFTMGENVPGTQSFDFQSTKKEFYLDLHSDSAQVKLLRTANTLRLRDGDNRDVVSYVLPLELYEAKSKIWGISNRLVSDNLLGACYIDQDKGWTLLNRGKAIANISFNIEDFVSGLAGLDLANERAEIKKIEQETKRYKFALGAAGYQRDVLENETQPIPSEDSNRDFSRQQQLLMHASYLKKRINAMKAVQKDNKRFAEYIEHLKLRIKDGSREIPVNRENLVGFEDQEKYLEAQVSVLKSNLKETERQIDAIQIALNNDGRLFSPGSDLDVIDRRIAGLKIDSGTLEKGEKELAKQKKAVKKSIASQVAICEPYRFIADTIGDFTERLGIYEAYSKDTHGPLTNNLKDKSGSYYQGLVFAFRLAYAKAIEKYCHLRLPLIIDSPRSGELNRENFAKYMHLLKDQFEGWQIIVASIEPDGIPADHTIEINRSLMEDAEINMNLSTLW